VKKFIRISLFTALFIMIISTVVSAKSTSPGLPAFPEPADPKSWVLPEDMTWDDYKPLPGIDWHDPDVEPELEMKGALIVVDFDDREFIISQEPGSMEAGNPIGIGNIPREEVGQFWVDFLNTPQPLNNYRTIDEYWRENTYGKWSIELEAFGPYRMDGKEFQYGMNEFGQQVNMPPGYEPMNLMPEAMEAAREDMEASGEDYDFTFILHAGYDESGVWQEFGEMMFQTPEDVTDDFGSPAEYDIPNWANTRYIDWTSWVAAKSIWSSANIRNGISVQGENTDMGAFAHEFGHIMNLLDNYNNPYADPVSRTYSGPWEMMSRGSFNGPGGPHSRWMVMPNLGGSSPSHHMLRNKIKQGLLTEDQYLNLNRDELSETGPVFADILSRSVPAGEGFERDGIHGINIEMEDWTPANSLEDDWRADMQRGEKWYDNYTIEVVDRVGFDSFAPDSGVLMAKTKDSESAPNIWVIDSHPEDIAQVDFERPDGSEAMYSLGDYRQLSDALFKAGTDQEVVSEYVDEHNRLHFYILENNHDEEGALSYRVAVRHLDGDGDFVRGVEAEIGETEIAEPGRVSVHNYAVTNTGEETDLIRVQAESDWETMVEHNVIEVPAGETVEVPVYVEIPEEASAPASLTFTATSETDPEQTTTIEDAVFNDISASGMKAFVALLDEQGAFENDTAIRALTTHLTTIEQYEDQRERNKVIRHMESFKLLLTHQLDSGLITAAAEEALQTYSDFLIEQWGDVSNESNFMEIGSKKIGV
jgi:M6 family metalloprotease-like protein